MATINGKGLTVTYNGQAITDYVNQQAVRDGLDRVMREIEGDTTVIHGTFSGSFTVTIRERPYRAHCNKRLRNRLQLAPYRRPKWGVN